MSCLTVERCVRHTTRACTPGNLPPTQQCDNSAFRCYAWCAGQAEAGIPDAIQTVADAVTQCKFEATYPGSDECVLYKILDVLVACMESRWSRLLTNENVINIFQACYRIGHYVAEKGKDTSELLTEASHQAMSRMVHTVFERLETFPESAKSTAGESAVSPMAAHATPRIQVCTTASCGAPGLPCRACVHTNTNTCAPFPPVLQLSPVPSALQPSSPVRTPTAADPPPGEEGSFTPDDWAAAAAAAAAPQEGNPLHDIVSVMPSAPQRHFTEVDGYGAEAIRWEWGVPGLACMHEVRSVCGPLACASHRYRCIAIMCSIMFPHFFALFCHAGRCFFSSFP